MSPTSTRSSTASEGASTPTRPSPSTASTSHAKAFVLSDNNFEKIFQDILARWQSNFLTSNDLRYLSTTHVGIDEYESITDQFRLKHGVELTDCRIWMNELPTRVHEYLSRWFDYSTQTCYGLSLVNLGSSSMQPSHSSIIVGIIYKPGSVKQPDSSFMPPNLPTPDRANGLMYQPGTFQHFPSLVYEVAVANEERERLLDDAANKMFSVHTSIACWIGLKIDLGNNVFWMGRGRRRLTGSGMRLEEQTEDDQSTAAYLPIYPYPQAALAGQFTIPSSLLFHPLPTPPNIPDEFVLELESVRAAIEQSIDLL